MDHSVGDNAIYEFGPFLLDPVRRRLMLDGLRIALTPTQLGVLLTLVENAGRVVEKDELLSAVWQGRIIEEGNISQTIYLLRRALKAGREDGAIVTAPGRGYRFAADVRRLTSDAIGRQSQSIPNPSGRKASRLAKLTPPRLPDTFPRERLFRKLEHALQRKIVWVSAPPGAGKTTLVQSFLRATARPCTWYVVDAGDTDPAGFFYYLSEALASIVPRALLPAFTSDYRGDITGFTRRFTRTLVDLNDIPLLLVLDNYQEAGHSLILSEITRSLAEELGLSSSIIVISRDDPPAAFARMRANQQMTVLGWEDVRLTGAETNDIVLRHDSHLAAHAADLHERSGGWAAGLTLLLHSRSFKEKTSGLSAIKAPEALFEYFATEFFENASEDTKCVLLNTAYLTRVTEAAAQFLSGRPDAGALLAKMARRRMFVDVYMAADTYFQYHGLLREFLCRQLDRLFGDEARTHLMRRSAKMAEHTGDLECALALYEQAKDFAAAATLMVGQAPILFSQGRSAFLQGWLLRQPSARLQHYPWLIYWLGLCTSWTDQMTGAELLRQAYAAFVQNGDTVGQIMTVCGIVDSYMTEWADVSGAEYWTGVLQEMEHKKPKLPAPSLELRLYSVLLAGTICFTSQKTPIAPWQSRVWELCRDGSRYGIEAGPRLMGAADLVQSLAWHGNSEMANAASTEFHSLAERSDVTPLQRCHWLSSRSWAHLIAGDVAAYKAGWALSEAIAIDAGLDEIVESSRLQIVHALMLDGKVDEASSRLRLIEKHSADRVVPKGLFYFTHAWLALIQDRPTDALECVELASDFASMQGGLTHRVITNCLYAQTHLALGHNELALARALESSTYFDRSSNSVLLFLSLLTEADVLYSVGQTKEGLSALERALGTGRRNGYFLVMPWLPTMMTRLVTLALDARMETKYTLQLAHHRRLAVDDPTLTDLDPITLL